MTTDWTERYPELDEQSIRRIRDILTNLQNAQARESKREAMLIPDPPKRDRERYEEAVEQCCLVRGNTEQALAGMLVAAIEQGAAEERQRNEKEWQRVGKLHQDIRRMLGDPSPGLSLVP